MTDLIDTLVGIAPGSTLDGLREKRKVARTHSQASHDALFAPAEPGAMSLDERFALGAYVCGLHRAEDMAAHYAASLPPALAATVAQAVAETLTEGPSGHYPAGPLSAENTPAPAFTLSAPVAEALGPRLVAGFAHAHYLVFHPRDALQGAFAPLHAAGWSDDAIVTLSQIISFLAYQIRVVAGLRVLAAAL